MKLAVYFGVSQLKNRFFVKSADGKVSVVGVDCLKKTGDQGLVDGVKRMQREKRQQDRLAKWNKANEARQAEQKARNNGYTNDELVAQLQEDREAVLSDHVVNMDGNLIVSSLTKFGFEVDMQHKAYLAQPFSNGMLNVLKDIHTKKVSGARKNSKAYKAAYIQCAEEVEALAEEINKTRAQAAALDAKIIKLKVGEA